jgi:uncharacterized protein
MRILIGNIVAADVLNANYGRKKDRGFASIATSDDFSRAGFVLKTSHMRLHCLVSYANQPTQNRMMFSRKLYALVTALVCALPVVANNNPPSCPPPVASVSPTKMQELAKNAKDRGFLWKIEKSGRTSYLYGTIHVNTLDWIMPGPKTMAAIEGSDTIAVELNLLDPEVQARMLDLDKLGVRSPAVNDSLRDRIREQLKRACAPIRSFDKQPAMMQIAGAMIFDARFLGLEAAYGSEMFLISAARSAKIPVVGLETVARQMRALVGDDASVDVIESSLAQIESGKARKTLSRMHQAWAAGTADDFENLASWCECLDTEADRKYIRGVNDDRNPDLAKSIDKLHREGKRVFAAVGALHMFGEKGLPKLMREIGYTVERVTFER